ncbi:MAG: cysteine desulfurase [Verrucomicrobia bacterium]|jgi:cysteine desulfurase|nr:cysteine desulfurase [Verrucomicrobiota bacterium]
MRRIFFDYQAGTPVRPEVFEAMRPWFTEHFGSTSSFHQQGLQARLALSDARSQFAQFINAEAPESILFTSGGTEAVNLAIKGAALAGKRLGNHIIYSAAEHPAVSGSVAWLETQGFKTTKVAVQPDGTIAPESIRAAITEETILICLHHSNFDLGTIQPVKEIATIAAERGITVFVDANFSAGWLPIDVQALGIQLLSLSPSRFYGPKGVGVLYRKRRTPLQNILHGGVQEDGRRPGSENLPAIVGAGVAATLAAKELSQRATHVQQLQQTLWQGLEKSVPEITFNGPPPGANRHPANIHFSLAGIEGEAVVLRCDLKGIALHSGTACVTKALKTSPALAAIGQSPSLAKGAILLTLGQENTEADVTRFLEIFPRIVSELRAMMP